MGEGGETLLNYGEYNKKHLHHLLRRLQTLWWPPRTTNPYG